MVRYSDHPADLNEGRRRQLGFLIIALLLTFIAPVRAEPERPFLAYHASWYEVPASRAETTTLARLPGYFTHIALSFVRPNLAYTDGSLDLTGTGLEYRFDGALLKSAIALLKSRQPGIRVLLAVGGATYTKWNRLNEMALVRLVRDLGADGVDVDFELPDPACVSVSHHMRCAHDPQLIDIIGRIRRSMPRPYVVSAAGWSVGAYGEGAFANAPPRSPWRGSMIGLLRSPAAADIDLISIMSYDAGPSYRPDEAFQAYRSYWRGPLALGVAVTQSVPGDPRFTLSRIQQMLAGIMGDPKAGAMLYALLVESPGPPGPDNPDYRAQATAICIILGKQGCDASLP